MKKTAVSKNSIVRKMLVLMCVLLLIQTLSFCVILFGSGGMQRLSQNAFSSFSERVLNRKNYLQFEMTQRWSNLGDTVSIVQEKTDSILESHGAEYRDIQANSDLSTEILGSLTDNLIYLMRKNYVTGVFVVLDGTGSVDRSGEVQRSGIYFCDSDPESISTNNSDLLIKRAPSSITQNIGLPMDTHWAPQFQFAPDADQEGYDFFYKPYEAALAHPDMRYSDLGYWSPPFLLEEGMVPVISYSVPLVSEDGHVFGVLGIELSANYLYKYLPYKELSTDQNASYLLAVSREGDLQFHTVNSSGPAYTLVFGDEDRISFEEGELESQFYRAPSTGRIKGQAYGCIQEIQLYNTNTPFVQEQWVLIGLVREQNLLFFPNSVRTILLLSLAISVVIGFASVVLLSTRFIRPIVSLAGQVQNMNPRLPVELPKTNILEIDDLASAIEKLSASVAESSSKFAQIMELSSMPLGAFEIIPSEDIVFYSKRLLPLLGIPNPPDSTGYLPEKEFNDILEQFWAGHPITQERDGTFTYQFTRPNSGEMAWGRLKVVYGENRILGVAEDITQETLEKRKIEYERDYDPLTNLLNRRAFQARMDALFECPDVIETAVLIMLDLDNLKYINDTYGHDCGDQYIHYTARTLKQSAPSKSVVSRMSGDEFYLFLYGFSHKLGAREAVQAVRQAIHNSSFRLPDGSSLRIRASAGIAWYPDDSPDYHQLIHYADFAMYSVKNTTKGTFVEFDMALYQKDAYLLRSKEDLNQLIDNELLDYHFQPIVSARTGQVFAYEALMRSRVSSLKSPLEILNLARSQSKLYLIERLTWFLSVQAFLSHPEEIGDAKLFFNSIANQMLSSSDLRQFESDFAKDLGRLVIEVTEGEHGDRILSQRKKDFAARWGAGIALDDYGSGYNSETMLLNLQPNYVKADISLVRGIDSDEARQEILRNLTSYSHERGILVIAEGVETREELEFLIRSGVDLLQGYYLAMPTPRPAQIRLPLIREIQDIQADLDKKQAESHSETL